MSGFWKPQGRTIKQPKIEGYTIATRKGAMYMVPKNKKGKLMWEMARFVGDAPATPLDPVESTVESQANPEEELYSELIENEFSKLDESK